MGSTGRRRRFERPDPDAASAPDAYGCRIVDDRFSGIT